MSEFCKICSSGSGLTGKSYDQVGKEDNILCKPVGQSKLTTGVEEEIRVSLKVLALKVNLQAQVYSFTPNEILQEPEPSKIA